tara:strand:- start:216 stop:395 length:180 start_codon:yes stop_codon:yes gene_type:complete
MKSMQNSLVGETNHLLGVGSASLTGSIMFHGDNAKQKKHLACRDTEVLDELGLVNREKC